LSTAQGWQTGAAQVLWSSRPVSWINTAFPFGAAYLLAGGGIDVAWVVGVLYFLIPYNLLMYGINDVFDYESDLRNPRKGGIEGAVLSNRWHRTTLWAAVGSNVPFLVFLALVGDLAAAAVLTVSVFAVVAYSAPRLRFKERPGLDSLTSATHFVSPAVYGIALADGAVTSSVVLALAAFFAWGAASQAFGAVQDITADRAGGLGSIATVFGARRTVRLALVGYLLASVLLLPLGWPGWVCAALPLLYVANVWPYRNLTDAECERANAGWRRFLWLNMVAGFVVTQVMILAALG